jgi:hypothetical protein
MSNVLGQLENESILLMYLAGELSDEDRAQVEQMLGRDPTLRAQLAELAATHDAVTGMLGRLDADSPVGASRREAAVRTVSRAMAEARRQRLAEAATAARTSRSRLNLKRFLIPAAVAAALVTGILLSPKTIEMKPPDGFSYNVADFPDVLAMEQKLEEQQRQPDPLSTLEQELLSLGTHSREFDADAWEGIEHADPVEER